MNCLGILSKRWGCAAALLFFAVPAAGSAKAETQELRIAQQFGIGYMPLVIMKARNLVEKHAQELGVAKLTVKWTTFAGGSAMNDALLSGGLDIASGGVPPFLTLWSRAADDNQVKIISAISQMPLLLNTINPNVKSLQDLTEADKIALPAVRSSNQAVILSMAAESMLGAGQVERINRMTVSMSHPDATAALLNGNISAHFAAPPFQYQQLRDPRVHTILNSNDVLGPFTFTVAWTPIKFSVENPLVYKAFVTALNEAIEFINTQKKSAVEIYLAETKSKEPPGSLLRIVSEPDVKFTPIPRAVVRYAGYMYRLGLIKKKPENAQEIFLPSNSNSQGN